jgi:hypothetical protein
MNTLNSLVTFLGTVPGRDRSCRIFQYLARTVAGLQESRGQAEAAAPFNSLSKQMGLARKVLRFGREIGLLIDTVKLAEQVGKDAPSKKSLVKVLKMLANLSLVLYFMSDHILFINIIQPIPHPRFIEWVDWVSNASWLAECLFGVVRAAIEINILQTEDSQQQLVVAGTELVKSAVDGYIAYYFLNTKIARKETIGALGTLTSLLGSYLIWK